MTVADQLRQEGMEKGMKETTLKTSRILVKQINRRFGKVSPMLKQKLMNADIDLLDKFGESIFDFENLEDAETWWVIYGNTHSDSHSRP